MISFLFKIIDLDRLELSLGSLKKLQEELPQDQFLRMHKSYMVNKDNVEALEGNMVLISDKKIPIVGSYKEEVMKHLFSPM